MPKRGAAALALTGFALALLLNFRTPDDGPATTAVAGSGTAGGTGGSAVTSGSTGSTGSGSTGSTGSTGSKGSATSGTGTSGSGGSTGSTGSTGTGSTGTTSQGTTTVDGPIVDTRYGAVQVEITVANGQLTAVRALQLPDQDRRSASISSRAEPILRSEALSAQSAAIDGVSGATYTSDGYEQSLQAALDNAGI
jgi:uncharacterized protein with FMN-binding domain